MSTLQHLLLYLPHVAVSNCFSISLQRSEQQPNHHIVQLHLRQSDQAVHAVSTTRTSNDFLIATARNEKKRNKTNRIPIRIQLPIRSRIRLPRGLDTIFLLQLQLQLQRLWPPLAWARLESTRLDLTRLSGARNSCETLSRDSCLSISCRLPSPSIFPLDPCSGSSTVCALSAIEIVPFSIPCKW